MSPDVFGSTNPEALISSRALRSACASAKTSKSATAHASATRIARELEGVGRVSLSRDSPRLDVSSVFFCSSSKVSSRGYFAKRKPRNATHLCVSTRVSVSVSAGVSFSSTSSRRAVSSRSTRRVSAATLGSGKPACDTRNRSCRARHSGAAAAGWSNLARRNVSAVNAVGSCEAPAAVPTPSARKQSHRCSRHARAALAEDAGGRGSPADPPRVPATPPRGARVVIATRKARARRSDLTRRTPQGPSCFEASAKFKRSTNRRTARRAVIINRRRLKSKDLLERDSFYRVFAREPLVERATRNRAPSSRERAYGGVRSEIG